MLTLTTEFFETCHKWDFKLITNDQKYMIYNYASLIRHAPTQFDMVMSFYRSWRDLCYTTVTCDGVDFDIESIYKGNWRLIK